MLPGALTITLICLSLAASVPARAKNGSDLEKPEPKEKAPAKQQEDAMADPLPPEQEFSALTTHLQVTSDRLSRLGSPLTVRTAAFDEEILKKGQTAYDAKQFQAAIFYLTSYLSFNPDIKRNAKEKALFQVAESYFQLGEWGPASERYAEFLDTAVRHPQKSNDADIETALNHLIEAAETGILAYDQRLTDLLNMLVQSDKAKAFQSRVALLIDYENDFRPIRQASAEVASHPSGESADKWSGQIHQRTGERLLRAGKSKEASVQFHVCYDDKKIPEKQRAACGYALAKMQVIAKQPLLGLNLLDEAARLDQGLVPEIEYDKIRLLISLKRYPEARAAAEKLVAAGDPIMHGYELHEIAINLASLAKDYPGAQKSLQAYLGILKTDRIKIAAYSNSLSGEANLELAPKILRTSKSAAAFATFDKARDLIAREQRVLGRTRADLALKMQLLAQASMVDYAPDFYQRYNSYQQIAFDLVAVGERLVQLEDLRFGEFISEFDKRKWQVIQKEKSVQLAKASRFVRENRPWRSLSRVIKLDQELDRSQFRLAQLNSRIAASAYQSRKGPDEALAIRAPLDARANMIGATIAQGRNVIAGREIFQLARFAPMNSMNETLREYSQLLEQQSALLAGYQGQDLGESGLTVLQDYRVAMDRHAQVILQLRSQLEEQDKQYQAYILKMLSDWADIDKRLVAAQGKLGRIDQSWRSAASARIYKQSSVTVADIDDRLVKLAKWQIDLDWMVFDVGRQQRQGKVARAVLENNIIRDALMNLDNQLF